MLMKCSKCASELCGPKYNMTAIRARTRIHDFICGGERKNVGCISSLSLLPSPPYTSSLTPSLPFPQTSYLFIDYAEAAYKHNKTYKK